MLKTYATSIDREASLVHIRLEQAHQAAKAQDQVIFENLAHSIKKTLDEQIERINSARDHLLKAGVGTVPSKFALEPDKAMDVDFNDDSDSESGWESEESDDVSMML